MIYHIGYVSSSARSMDEGLLSEILEVSVRNNERDGITCVLMYHDNQFFQLLEGEQSVVKRCFARIERDQRHRGVSVVWDDFAESRVFSSWAMGYAGPEEFGNYTDHSTGYLAKLLGGELSTKDSICVALRFARYFFKEFERSYSLTRPSSLRRNRSLQD